MWLHEARDPQSPTGLKATRVSPAMLCHGWLLTSHHAPGPLRRAASHSGCPALPSKRAHIGLLFGPCKALKHAPGEILVHVVLLAQSGRFCFTHWCQCQTSWSVLKETQSGELRRLWGYGAMTWPCLVWQTNINGLHGTQFLALTPLCVLTLSVSQRAHKEMPPPQLSDMRVYHHLAGSLSLAG